MKEHVEPATNQPRKGGVASSYTTTTNSTATRRVRCNLLEYCRERELWDSERVRMMVPLSHKRTIPSRSPGVKPPQTPGLPFYVAAGQATYCTRMLGRCTQL